MRPLFDSVTAYTFDEAQDAIDYLKKKGCKIIDLAKEDAVREKVEETLKQHPNAKLSHYDHGNDKCIWGNDNRPVVDLKNVDLLANRVCYNDNCSSAKKLGVEAWKIGATYWGYKDLFYFSTDATDEFKQFVNNGIKQRVDGKSWKKSLELTKNLATKLIDKLVKNGKGLAAACMRHDRDVLVLYSKDNPPKSDCNFRRISVRLFGPDAGWRISWRTLIGIALFWLSLGVMLHDYCHECWLYGGYPEILSLQGFYIGFAISVVSFIILIREHVKWLKRTR